MPEISSAKLSIDARLLPAGPAHWVIDVGCGDGRHVAAAASRGCIAIGVDFDPVQLREAKRRCGPLPVQLIAADAAHLPFRDAVFDAAICTETLEHLADDAGAMRGIARVLQPGALLLGAVPSHFTERVYFALSAGYRTAPGGHMRIYRPRRLFGLLRAAGFDLESMRYVHFVDSMIWLRFCLTDFLRPARPRSAFESAVLIAEAAGRPVAGWRTSLRRAMTTSRFIAAIDHAGAYVWPKSLCFVARRVAAPVLASPKEAPVEAAR